MRSLLIAPCRIQDPNIPRAGRVGAAHGGAGPGRTGRRRIGSSWKQPSLVLPRASSTYVLNASPGARTSEILCKPVEEPNPLLTSGLSAVYPRDDGRSSFLAADQWTGANCVFVNLFHARHVRENKYFTYIHIKHIPGDALHEKGLEGQKSASPLVSSRKRRALLVPRRNCGSNAGQTRIFLHRFT